MLESIARRLLGEPCPACAERTKDPVHHYRAAHARSLYLEIRDEHAHAT